MRRLALAGTVPVIVTGALWMAALAAERPEPAGAPTRALIVVEAPVSRAGVARPEAIVIADAKKLAALESFFPGYRRRPASNTAGGWEPDCRVYFDFPHETIRVTLSANDNGATWTTGRGDFATQGDWSRFLAELRKL